MAWRPDGWDKISPKPAHPFEAGRDVWCRFCSYRNFERGAAAMLDALQKTGTHCTIGEERATLPGFGQLGTKGWLVFIPDKKE